MMKESFMQSKLRRSQNKTVDAVVTNLNEGKVNVGNAFLKKTVWSKL